MIKLISAWLKNRLYYVSIEGNNSTFYDLLLGTDQGSILGPILYAIFTSPLFDVEDMLRFADDNFIPRSDSSLPVLIKKVELALDFITKWMRNSGLKVNDAKTEACLFYRKDCMPVRIKVGLDSIATKKTLNVLGVIFDYKLQWTEQVAKAILKSR